MAGRYVFTAGSVLTAAQVNDYLMDQSVMVFGGTAERGSAIGTATEGMFSYLTDTDVVQYYDGASWTNLAGGTQALQLIKTQTIGTAVSSVEVTDAFSADYENYCVMINGGTASVDNAILNLTLGASATGYDWVRIGTTYAGNNDETANSNDSKWVVGFASTLGNNCQIIFIEPFLANRTRFYSDRCEMVAASGASYCKNGGYHRTAASYTSFTITPNSGTLTDGTIRIYGIGG